MQHQLQSSAVFCICHCVSERVISWKPLLEHFTFSQKSDSVNLFIVLFFEASAAGTHFTENHALEVAWQRGSGCMTDWSSGMQPVFHGLSMQSSQQQKSTGPRHKTESRQTISWASCAWMFVRKEFVMSPKDGSLAEMSRWKLIDVWLMKSWLNV